jgi:hypothetical protein
LRQQINVFRRRMPKRPALNNTDRFLFVWLYHWFPSVLGAIAIVRPETIIRWHRSGFRAYWRWRSRNPAGRPKVSAELRTLIGDMSRANPLWGAPRMVNCSSSASRSRSRRSLDPRTATLSGLADVSQQPYRRHRSGRPLRPANNHFPDPLLPRCHSAQPPALGIVWRDSKSDCGVALAPDHRGFPVGSCASIPNQGSRRFVRASLLEASAGHGHSRSTDRTPITVAKCICREAHRLDPPGMPGPHDCVR